LILRIDQRLRVVSRLKLMLEGCAIENRESPQRIRGVLRVEPLPVRDHGMLVEQVERSCAEGELLIKLRCSC
jgi:hypothetical protein